MLNSGYSGVAIRLKVVLIAGIASSGAASAVYIRTEGKPTFRARRDVGVDAESQQSRLVRRGGASRLLMREGNLDITEVLV